MDHNSNNNSKQDEGLTILENQGLDLDNNLSSLESEDFLLQKAIRPLTGRATLNDE